jgi:glycosyltransferase involved in cell wall biosynthesis
VSASDLPLELSIIVPCFNEEGNLELLVARMEQMLAQARIQGEILLINDASSDRTGPMIDALAATHPAVRAIHHAVNRGITGGWQSGFAAARGRWVCTIDADLQYQPEDIAVLYREAVTTGVSLVQGRRRTDQRDRRYAMSRGLDLLLKAVFAMPEHDVKSGFVVYRHDVFGDILTEAPRFHYFQHMITVVAKAKGYSLRQVETRFAARHAGKSFIGSFPLRMLALTLVDIGRAVRAYRFRSVPAVAPTRSPRSVTRAG